MVNVTELFVLVNATWSALNVPGAQLDPVSERIVREVDAIIFAGGCALNCCEAPETAMEYTGSPGEDAPPACKEARQISRCTSLLGAEFEAVCTSVVTDTVAAARRHDKTVIQRAMSSKRAALSQRLKFLLEDIADQVAAYNVILSSESIFRPTMIADHGSGMPPAH